MVSSVEDGLGVSSAVDSGDGEVILVVLGGKFLIVHDALLSKCDQ
jgi:hypothetical protein